jgi:hypothetical protein
MRISRIKITNFPQYDNGSNWDFLDGPDLYVTLSLGQNVIHSQLPQFFEDAVATNDYSYYPNALIDLNSPTSQYAIRLYDYDDGLGDDYVGGYSFYPYPIPGGGFPTVFTLSGATMSFEFTVSYEW